MEEEPIPEEELPKFEDEVEPIEEIIEEEELQEPEGEEEPPLTPREEIPIRLSVEVGRLKMSAEKLLNLQPGNTLELPATAGAMVDLVVEGKRIGRGELLQIGDLLGVRIVDLS